MKPPTSELFFPNSESPVFEDLAELLRGLGEQIANVGDTITASMDNRRAARADTLPLRTMVSRAIEARKRRGTLFAPSLFSDPAWDILLHLFAAELDQKQIHQTQLAELANIPATTAYRWLSVLVDKRMLARRPDPTDGRRVFMVLNPDTSAVLREYFMSLDVPAA